MNDDLIQLNDDLIQLNNDLIQLNDDLIQLNDDLIQLNDDLIQLNDDLIQLTVQIVLTFIPNEAVVDHIRTSVHDSLRRGAEELRTDKHVGGVGSKTNPRIGRRHAPQPRVEP